MASVDAARPAEAAAKRWGGAGGSDGVADGALVELLLESSVAFVPRRAPLRDALPSAFGAPGGAPRSVAVGMRELRVRVGEGVLPAALEEALADAPAGAKAWVALDGAAARGADGAPPLGALAGELAALRRAEARAARADSKALRAVLLLEVLVAGVCSAERAPRAESLAAAERRLARCRPPPIPTPPSRTKWTLLVHPSVLTGREVSTWTRRSSPLPQRRGGGGGGARAGG